MVAAPKPRGYARYNLPFQVARDGADWKISHGPPTIPLEPISINPDDEELFEPINTWISGDGRYMVGQIDTKPDGNHNPWPIEADETWVLKYEVRAANAKTATIEVRVYVENGAVCVERITPAKKRACNL